MELAMRAMNSGYFTHDLVTDEVVYSSSFRDKMNFSETMKESEFRDHIHPEDKDEAYLQHKREITSDSAYYVNTYRIRASNQTHKHFEVQGFKVFNAKGVPIKLVGNLIDVEDKYRLTYMQDKHRYHIKTLLDNSFIRSIMLDAHWNLLGMDGETLKLFEAKLDRNPVIRKENFKKLLSGHDTLKFQIIERVLNDGREYRNQVLLDLFEDNKTYYDALFKPILNYSNEIDGYVFYFFDLTDQLGAQENLKSYQEKLRTVHRFKNNIINKMGHEIKTPLHGLLQTTKLIHQQDALENHEKESLISAQQESADPLMSTFDNIINSSLYEENFFIIKDKSI